MLPVLARNNKEYEFQRTKEERAEGILPVRDCHMSKSIPRLATSADSILSSQSVLHHQAGNKFVEMLRFCNGFDGYPMRVACYHSSEGAVCWYARHEVELMF